MTAIAMSQPILPEIEPFVAGVTVTVTGTLKDSAGNNWNGAQILIQFIPGFGQPIGNYTFNGAPFTQQQIITATGNTFSVALPSNDTIIPIDSSWQFIISVNPFTPAVIITKVLDSRIATTFDLSTQFTAIAPPLQTSGGGAVGLSPQIIKVADQPTAIAQSSANPNNFYYWV